VELYFFRASAQNGRSVCLFTFVPAFFTLATGGFGEFGESNRRRKAKGQKNQDDGKSGSADVRICGCRNRDRGMVRDRVNIRVMIRLRYKVRIRNGVRRWFN